MNLFSSLKSINEFHYLINLLSLNLLLLKLLFGYFIIIKIIVQYTHLNLL